MLESEVHRKKPAGRPMAKATARANARKSAVRARIEHVFAYQKNRLGLFIRTIGLARAESKLIAVNLGYNFDRLVFHERRAMSARLCPECRKQAENHPKNAVPSSNSALTPHSS